MSPAAARRRRALERLSVKECGVFLNFNSLLEFGIVAKAPQPKKILMLKTLQIRILGDASYCVDDNNVVYFIS